MSLILYILNLIQIIEFFFSPLVQSPVKLRVEAFENAAAAATEQSKRPLRSKKENLTSSVRQINNEEYLFK